MPERDEVLVAAVDQARRALEQITPPSTIGAPADVVVEGEHVLSHRFSCTLPGYPGWFWTVTLARVDESADPSVLEVELLPGDHALLAPDWIPWSERLAEYQAALEAEQALKQADESSDGEASGGGEADGASDELDELDDEDDADDDLDEGDIDGVDIDELHDLGEQAENPDDSDDDADYVSEEITGAELAALELGVDQSDDTENDADAGAPQPPRLAGGGQVTDEEQQHDQGENPQP